MPLNLSAMPAESHEKNPWTIIGRNAIYDNPWISVTEFQVLNPAGGNGIYGKVHFKNKAIGVVPLDAEHNTYLVGQYRFPLDEYSWEIPEGGCPLGTDPLETAKRELIEETGLRAGEWTHLQEVHLSNSISDEHGHIFLARDLEQGESAPEDTEKLQVKKLPLSEACELIRAGKITDSVTVIGLLRVELMLLKGEVL